MRQVEADSCGVQGLVEVHLARRRPCPAPRRGRGLLLQDVRHSSGRALLSTQGACVRKGGVSVCAVGLRHRPVLGLELLARGVRAVQTVLRVQRVVEVRGRRQPFWRLFAVRVPGAGELDPRGLHDLRRGQRGRHPPDVGGREPGADPVADLDPHRPRHRRHPRVLGRGARGPRRGAGGGHAGRRVRLGEGRAHRLRLRHRGAGRQSAADPVPRPDRVHLRLEGRGVLGRRLRAAAAPAPSLGCEVRGHLPRLERLGPHRLGTRPVRHPLLCADFSGV
mmetsp:Transcript_90652/g.253274  ORF Transcript_90652/g.253274 Transcript_90652/m.253274 type:complete len:278 (+) Transcript_90652:968-1801(+)